MSKIVDVLYVLYNAMLDKNISIKIPKLAQENYRKFVSRQIDA